LRDTATAMIDISDGLVADLRHVLTASGVGARVNAEAIPLSSAFLHGAEANACRDLALTGGDDYELCFTVPADREAALGDLVLDCPVTRIGTVETAPGLRLVDGQGCPYALSGSGFDHFRSHE